jgi:hypothetical protein
LLISFLSSEDHSFASCLIEVPEATTATILLPEGLQSPSVPAELGLCFDANSTKPKPDNNTPDAPDFPDFDPGISLSPAKFYEAMAANGFYYGPQLRLLQDIRLIGFNKIRTRCKKPVARWILFDLALQTLSAGLFDVRSPVCYVPVRIEEVYSNFPADWAADGEGQCKFTRVFNQWLYVQGQCTVR